MTMPSKNDPKVTDVFAESLDNAINAVLNAINPFNYPGYLKTARTFMASKAIAGYQFLAAKVKVQATAAYLATKTKDAVVALCKQDKDLDSKLKVFFKYLAWAAIGAGIVAAIYFAAPAAATAAVAAAGVMGVKAGLASVIAIASGALAGLGLGSFITGVRELVQSGVSKLSLAKVLGGLIFMAAPVFAFFAPAVPAVIAAKDAVWTSMQATPWIWAFGTAATAFVTAIGFVGYENSKVNALRGEVAAQRTTAQGLAERAGLVAQLHADQLAVQTTRADNVILEANTQAQTHEGEKAALEDQVTELEAEMNALRDDEIPMHQQIAERLQLKIAALTAQKVVLVDSLAETVTQAETATAAADREIRGNTNTIATLTSTVQRREAALGEARNDRDANRTKIAELTGDLDSYKQLAKLCQEETVKVDAEWQAQVGPHQTALAVGLSGPSGLFGLGSPSRRMRARANARAEEIVQSKVKVKRTGDDVSSDSSGGSITTEDGAGAASPKDEIRSSSPSNG
jgi:hypothetical protein